ncbi:hypothetical protein GQ600_26284 [Phytophthora cactorum]|nr:hypothetical protein GQ600_26284 [Phytophthora cactorum]
MDGVVVAVERSIASELPLVSGLCSTAGRTPSSTTSPCSPATRSRQPETPLLSMAPLLNEINDNLPAESHLDFLATMLPRDFGVQLEQCRFIAKNRSPTSYSPGDEVEFDLSMIKRYVELSEFIDVEDETSWSFFPRRHVKGIQGPTWFDELIKVKPQYARFIGPRANIVYSPDFESGCVRVLRGKVDRLTRSEKSGSAAVCCRHAGQRTRKHDRRARVVVESLRNRRRLGEESVEYEQRKSIPPMPNVVERFLSVARVKFGHQRHGLLPRTLEAILFLRENCEYWDASTVDSLQ